MRQVVSDIYRFGPVSITILMILAMIAVPAGSLYHYNDLLENLFYLCLVIVLLWHLLLIASEENKPVMVLYAIAHLPIIYVVGLYAGMSVTGNWL